MKFLPRYSKWMMSLISTMEFIIKKNRGGVNDFDHLYIAELLLGSSRVIERNLSFINLTIAHVILCEAFFFVTILPITCLLKKNNSKRDKKT